MGYGYGTGQALPARRSGVRTAGKWMTIIGGVLSLLTIAFMIWAFMTSVDYINSLDSEDAVSMDSGPVTVSMAEAESRMIFGEGSFGCEVTTPDGATRALEATEVPAAESGSGGAETVLEFTSDRAGDHTFSCDGGTGVTLSPPMDLLALLAMGGIVLGILALLLFGTITLIGIILWIVGRNKDRRLAREREQFNQGHYGQGGYPGQYGQGQYGQGPQDGYAYGPPPGGGSGYGGYPGQQGQQGYSGQGGQGGRTPDPEDPYRPPER